MDLEGNQKLLERVLLEIEKASLFFVFLKTTFQLGFCMPEPFTRFG